MAINAAEAVEVLQEPVRVTRVNRKQEPRSILSKIIFYTVMVLLSLLFIFPFVWMVISSLKPEHQLFQWPPIWIPDPVMWSNYVEAFSNPFLPFDVFFRNTMILEVGIIAGRLISTTLVAYGFARLRAPGKDFLFLILIMTLLLPGAVLLIPKYIFFSQIGWVNTFRPLIVPAWFGEAYAIFLFRQFFMTLPRELEESAVIDGAGTLQIIWRIIIPLSIPVYAVIFIFSFRDIWNDFMGPLLYLSNLDKYTISVGLAFFSGQYTSDPHLQMAASVVFTLPIIILFFFAQRAFVEGIQLTGLKG
jgi:multiple sugar transport system permease protein